jgi:hypothetical protein
MDPTVHSVKTYTTRIPKTMLHFPEVVTAELALREEIVMCLLVARLCIDVRQSVRAVRRSPCQNQDTVHHRARGLKKRTEANSGRIVEACDAFTDQF